MSINVTNLERRKSGPRLVVHVAHERGGRRGVDDLDAERLLVAPLPLRPGGGGERDQADDEREAGGGDERLLEAGHGSTPLAGRQSARVIHLGRAARIPRPPLLVKAGTGRGSANGGRYFFREARERGRNELRTRRAAMRTTSAGVMSLVAAG